MDKKVERLLSVLDDEIEKKCYEIKKNQAEQKFKKIFVSAAALFLLVPILMAFTGINLLTVGVPFISFLTLAMFSLSPIILNKNSGGITL